MNAQTGLIKLHALMQDALFTDEVKAAHYKSHLQQFVKPMPTDEALHQNFIWYGNKKATRFIIIDIDYVNTPLQEYSKQVKRALGFTPSWILKSSKGYHVGFILDEPVFYTHTNSNVTTEAFDKLITVRYMLSSILDADTHGSLRAYGYWRNPLTHNATINPETFSINDLYKRSHKAVNQKGLFFEYKPASTKVASKEIRVQTKTQILKDGFTPGNRNTYLFHAGINLLLTGEATKETIFDYLESINEMHQDKLNISEIRTITKSLIKYDLKPSSSTKRTERPIRGKYSNLMFDNNIHNAKIDNKHINQRQVLGSKLTAAKKKAKTVTELLKASIELLNEGKSITGTTNKHLASKIERSVRTLQRYKDIRKEISAKALLEFVRSMAKGLDPQAMFRANVTPLINKALRSIEFIEKKYKKVFVFAFTDTGELEFFEKSSV